MPKVERPTIRHIAAALGLSVNTVSRALTGKGDVSVQTRKRVLAEADRVGYIPNGLARSLVTGSAMTIGLILTNPSNPIFAELITAVEQGAQSQGYGLLLATSQEDARREAQAVEMLLKWRVGGILLVTVGSGAIDHLRRLRASGTPFVLVHRDIPELNADLAAGDNILGGYLATRHLIGLGHSRIAALARDASTPTAALRIAGYRRALAEAGLPVDEALVLSTAPTHPGDTPLWSPEGTYRTCLRLAQLPDRPTAVFVTDDFFALGAYRAFAEMRLRIPGDIAVVGYGETNIAPYMVPPLTSVSSPQGEIGAAGLKLLLARMRGQRADGTPRKELVTPALQIRASTVSRQASAPTSGLRQ